MNSKSLPAKPSLEHLKTQAQDLLFAAKSGDAAALSRMHAALPNLPVDLALHDAQSAIAREYGFASWRALRERVETGANVVALPQPLLDAACAVAIAVDAREIAIPDVLPLVPLRDAMITAAAVVSLDVVRPDSLAALAEAERGDQLVAIFAQRDAATEAPTTADLHPVGVVARLVKVMPRLDRASIVVGGIAWIRLVAVEGARARIVPFTVDAKDGEGHVDDLRRLVRRAVKELPHPGSIARRIDAMTALELADAAAGSATAPIAAMAKYAAESQLSARVDRAIAFIGG